MKKLFNTRSVLASLIALTCLAGCGKQPTEQPTPEPSVQPTVEPTIEPTNYLETEYNLSFDSQLSDLVFEYFMNGSGTDGDQFLIKSDLINNIDMSFLL